MSRGNGYICPECGKLHVAYSPSRDIWKCPKCGYKGKDFQWDEEYEQWLEEEGCRPYDPDDWYPYHPDKSQYIRWYGIPRNPEFRKKWMEEIEQENKTE